MTREAALNAAARRVFPTAGFSTVDSDCLYPVEALHYADADVLITMVGKPGEACHGCGADLSAYVLGRSKGRSAVVARFAKFASSGTFGKPGQIKALRLVAHDAFVIKASGTFQGHTSTTLSFFVFNAGRLVELEPFLPLSADNAAGVENEKEAVSVDGAWTLDPANPDVITITYKVKSHGRERPESVSWAVQGTTLKIARGRVPPEYDVASGN